MIGFAPTFTDTVEYAKKSGMAFQAVPSDPHKGLIPDIEAMVNAISPNTSVVYIDNPNNPTGWVSSLAEIERVLKTAEAAGACLIVDEATVILSPGESSVNLLDHYENLIVIRSMSKVSASRACGPVISCRRKHWEATCRRSPTRI
jgi:histidinol-phosphate aminotransferase